jgi:potassium uptake protein trkH
MIVFTVALLPIFGGTASQLFDAETTGITHDRFRPRITQVAKRIFGLYVLITLAILLLLWIGPMNLFDALNHAMTTVATGGYSTKNNGLAYWHSAYTEYIVILGMFIGATNFTLLYFALRGHSQKLFHDHEFRWFCIVIATTTIVTTAWILLRHNETNPELAFRHALFHITSLISTTGLLTVNYSSWGSFFAFIALFVIIVAGCAGSTSGGLKMGRFMILVKDLLNEFKRQTHPRAVLPLRAGGQVIPEHVVQRVYTFAIIYVGLILFGCTVLTFEGIDLGDALGLAATSVGNAGPGIGHFADGNFSAISSFNKWILSFLMIVGRLEIFTVLTPLLPGFWRR